MFTNKITVIFLILLFASIFACCSFSVTPVYKDKAVKVENNELKEKAVKAVENLHKLLETEKYEEIYEMVDEKSPFKSDKSGFIDSLKEVNEQLGKLQSIKLTNSNVFKKEYTFEVRMEFLTKFEKDTELPKRFELFGWEMYENGEAKLLFYTSAKGEDNE